MKKLASFLLALSILPALARPGFTEILAEYNLRDTSARLDILQLDVSIEDETNVIGLEKWSDNPAGLVMDEEKSRAVISFSKDESTVKSLTSETTYKTTMPGLYAVYRGEHQAISAQANQQKQTRSSTDREDTQLAGQVRYNYLWDVFSLGAQAGLLDESTTQPNQNDIDYKSDPFKGGVGLGFKKNLSQGRLLFGANMTQASYKLDTAGTRTTADETALSVQTILQKSDRLKAGLMATVTGSNEDSSTTETKNTQTEIRTRGLVGLFQLPLRFGWEISLANIDGERNTNGLRTRDSDSDLNTVNAGVSWGSSEKGLLGVELRRTTYETSVTNYSPSSHTNSDWMVQYLTLGGEYPIVKAVALRLSYALLDQETTSTSGIKTKYEGNVAGAGVGIKIGSRGKLDAGLLHVSVDNKTTPGSGDTDEDKFEVVGSLYFN